MAMACAFVIFLFIPKILTDGDGEDLAMFIGAIAGAIFFFFAVKAEFPGVVIDVENDKFSFPGGELRQNLFLNICRLYFGFSVCAGLNIR